MSKGIVRKKIRVGEISLLDFKTYIVQYSGPGGSTGQADTQVSGMQVSGTE